MINGNYYGLYVVEEDVDGSVIKQFFPEQPGRRSVEGRRGAGDQQDGARLEPPEGVLGRGRPRGRVGDRRPDPGR